MGFLRVLDLLCVEARCVGKVVLAVQLDHLRPGRGNGGFGEVRRVGPHVGDEAVFVKALSDAHRALRRKPKLAAGFLLECRRHEGRVRRAPVGLLLHRPDHERHTRESLDQTLGPPLIQRYDVRVGAKHTVGTEVLTGRQANPVQSDHRCRERFISRRGKQTGEIPVSRCAEAHAGPFPLDNQPGRDALHPPGGKAGHDLLPQDRRDLVAVKTVEDPTTFLGVDQVSVEITGLLDRTLDRRLRDLVKHHSLHGYFRLQHLKEMPRDRLTFAVFVGCEVQLTSVFDERLQLRDVSLLLVGHDIKRCEPVVDIDAEFGPGLTLHGFRNICGAPGKVPDVADRRLNDEAAPEKPRDRLRFCRGFDDDQRFAGANRTGLGGRS